MGTNALGETLRHLLRHNQFLIKKFPQVTNCKGTVMKPDFSEAPKYILVLSAEFQAESECSCVFACMYTCMSMSVCMSLCKRVCVYVRVCEKVCV